MLLRDVLPDYCEEKNVCSHFWMNEAFCSRSGCLLVETKHFDVVLLDVETAVLGTQA